MPPKVLVKKIKSITTTVKYGSGTTVKTIVKRPMKKAG
jgi:hypothetical protein